MLVTMGFAGREAEEVCVRVWSIYSEYQQEKDNGMGREGTLKKV
jgi:hypothetical protein